MSERPKHRDRKNHEAVSSEKKPSSVFRISKPVQTWWSKNEANTASIVQTKTRSKVTDRSGTDIKQAESTRKLEACTWRLPRPSGKEQRAGQGLKNQLWGTGVTKLIISMEKAKHKFQNKTRNTKQNRSLHSVGYCQLICLPFTHE